MPLAVFHECNLEQHIGREVFRRVSAALPGATSLQSPAESGAQAVVPAAKSEPPPQ